jgi:TolB-like protein
MESRASESWGRRIFTTGREYLTHWTIAGAVITLTGFSPDHWVADLLRHAAIPDSLRVGWLPTFDVRIALVGIGVAIIAWDVLRRSRLQRKEAPHLVSAPGPAAEDQIAEVAASQRKSPPTRSGLAVVLHGELRAFAVLMGDDVAAARRAVSRGQDLLRAAIADFGGRLAQAPADAILAMFDDAARCVACAVTARAALARANAALPAAERVHYRFGIDLRESAAAGAPPPREAIERAAAIGLRAPTDGIRLTEAVRGRLPDDGTHGFSAVEPGLFALDDRDPPATPWTGPPQLESFAPPLPERPSILLLPFGCPGQDPDGIALADGLRLDIQNALVKMSGIFQIAAGTGNALRGAEAFEAARRVGVRHVLEGTVQRHGERVRVSVQLTDTLSGAVVWSEKYDRVLDHTFELQDEIAARVVTTLDVKLASGEQARIWHKCLTSPKPREQFYRGMQAFFQMNREAMAAAQTCFERVTELVPDSPIGHSMMAMCLWFQVARGWTDDPEATRAAAGKWAERAAAMPDADGQAHTVLGNVRLLQRRFDEALAIAREAVVIRPNCTNANSFLANVLLHCGEPEAALGHVKRAIRHAPVYPPWFIEILATAYRDSGQVDFAVAAAHEGLRIAPQSINSRLILASTLVRGGWLADAQRVAREVLSLEPAFSLARHAAQQPYRDAAVLDRLISELRSAGLGD